MEALRSQTHLHFNSNEGLDSQEVLPSAYELKTRAGKACEAFSDLEPTIVFFEYWRFACERQRIFYRRMARQDMPWTADAIFKEYKFTNAYRVLDRVSQFLVREVQSGKQWSASNLFFRTILFKFFNRISTWKLLRDELNEELTLDNFSIERYSKILERAQAKGSRIYSAAYIMPSGGRGTKFHRKYELHLWLLSQMMKDELPKHIEQAFSMAKAFQLLKQYSTIGDFLAYQYVTDLNYSRLTNFDESSFVVPGPGARDGLKKCFHKLNHTSEAEVIIRMAEAQHEIFRELNLNFLSLGNRPLQYIDCQNLLCEVDKYSRIAHPEFTGNTGRVRIKQRFTAEREALKFVLPHKPGWPTTSSLQPLWQQC